MTATDFVIPSFGIRHFPVRLFEKPYLIKHHRGPPYKARSKTSTFSNTDYSHPTIRMHHRGTENTETSTTKRNRRWTQINADCTGFNKSLTIRIDGKTIKNPMDLMIICVHQRLSAVLFFVFRCSSVVKTTRFRLLISVNSYGK